MIDDTPKHGCDARLRARSRAGVGCVGHGAHVLGTEPHPPASPRVGAHRRTRNLHSGVFPSTRAAPASTVGHASATWHQHGVRRFARMSGRNVLHTMGYDTFGLPASTRCSRAAPQVAGQGEHRHDAPPLQHARPRPRLASATDPGLSLDAVVARSSTAGTTRTPTAPAVGAPARPRGRPRTAGPSSTSREQRGLCDSFQPPRATVDWCPRSAPSSRTRRE